MASSSSALAIDPAGTTDVDDALEVLDATARRLHVRVHLSAPATLPEIDADAVDAILASRETRYHARGKTPMLPGELEEAATLTTQEARPSISVDVEVLFSPRLTVSVLDVSLNDVQLARQVPYEDVPGLIAQGDAHLAALERAARALFDDRRTSGALVVLDEERDVYISGDGGEGRATIGNIIVQEWMILTNQLLAEWCRVRGVPILWRNHALPGDPEHAAERHELLEALEAGDPIGALGVLRPFMHQMPPATYDSRRIGHAGLGLLGYAHMTSPLRRAPDFVNQMQLLAYLQRAPLPWLTEGLDEVLRQLVEQASEASAEQAREDAQAHDWKAIRAMEKKPHRLLHDDSLLSRAVRVFITAPERVDEQELVGVLEQRAEPDGLPITVLEALIDDAAPDWMIERALADLLEHIDGVPGFVQHLLRTTSLDLTDPPRLKRAVRRSGPSHAPTFSLTMHEHPVFARSKSEAAKRASFIDLAHALGYPEVVPKDWSAPPEEEWVEQDGGVVAPPKAQKSPSPQSIASLNEWAQRSGHEPEFDFSRDPDSTWRCLVHVADVSGEGRGTSKKAAKQVASWRAIQALLES